MIRANEIKGVIIALLIIAILFFGCMPKAKKEIIIPRPEGITTPIIPADIIDEKISMLKEFLNKKEISQEERDNAIGLLSDYTKIRSLNNAGISDKNYQEMIRILLGDLNMFEERYLVNRAILEDQSISKVINQYYSEEQKILDRYLSGDYQGVISKCAELESSFGRNSLTPDIGLLLAMSLAKSDRLNEAIDIGGEIVEALEGRPDLIHLRASIIEWQLDKGNREKALKLFEKLIEDLDERKAVFESVNERIGNDSQTLLQMEGIAPGGLSSMDMDLYEAGGIKKVLEEVDSLMKKKAFEEAKLLLLKLRLRTEKSSEIEIIEQALKSVNLEEQKYRDGISQEEEAVERITKSIEQEDYKDAINALETMDNDRNKRPEIKRLRDIAVEKLINSERNRAAQIYLTAKKTNNNKKKRELLLSSYNILKGLIDSYPSSSLIDKLKIDLSKIEDNLKSLD